MGWQSALEELNYEVNNILRSAKPLSILTLSECYKCLQLPVTLNEAMQEHRQGRIQGFQRQLLPIPHGGNELNKKSASASHMGEMAPCTMQM